MIMMSGRLRCAVTRASIPPFAICTIEVVALPYGTQPSLGKVKTCVNQKSSRATMFQGGRHAGPRYALMNLLGQWNGVW